MRSKHVTSRVFAISLACLALLVLGQLAFQRQYFGSMYIDQKRAEFGVAVAAFVTDVDGSALTQGELLARMTALNGDKRILTVLVSLADPAEPAKPGRAGGQPLSPDVESAEYQVATDTAAAFRKHAAGGSAAPETVERDGYLIDTRIVTIASQRYVLVAVTSVQPVNEAIDALDRTIPYVLGIVVLACVALSLLVSRIVARPLIREAEGERRLNERQRAFIANASHELKTPISIISGLSEDIADHRLGEEQRREHVAIIYDEAQRMSRLVSSMLDSARAQEAGPPVWVELNLSGLIDATVTRFQTLTAPRRLSVQTDVDGGLTVRADEAMLDAIVGNIMSNAVFHTPEGGSIWISAQRGDGVTLSVENEGDPIPDDAMPHLWESFYRGEAHRGREEGRYGLGLSIAAAYADRLGAALEAENTARGVRFSVRLGS